MKMIRTWTTLNLHESVKNSAYDNICAQPFSMGKYLSYSKDNKGIFDTP